MGGWAAAAQAGIELADRGFEFWMNERANRQRASLMREQMGWAEHMFDTRYQKSVQDMRKAGLNPILAAGAGLGGGGSPGQGGVPGITTPSTNSKDALLKTAMVEEAFARIANTKQDTAKKLEETYKTAHEGANLIQQFKYMDQLITSAKAQAERDKEMGQFYETDFGKKIRQLEIILKSVNPMAAPMNAAKNLTR